jgi:hypothetical protein
MTCGCSDSTSPGSVGRYDSTIPRGATWTRTFTWKVGDPALPVDLTGMAGRMTLSAPNYADVSLTTDNGGLTFGGAAGTITALIAATATDEMAVTTYAYDLEIVAGAVVTRLLQGYQTVTPNITV